MCLSTFSPDCRSVRIKIDISHGTLKDWQESQGKAGQTLQTKTLKNKCGKFWLCTTPGPVCSQAKSIISLSRKTWIFKQKFLGIPNLQVAPLARRFKHCLSILKVRCVQPKGATAKGEVVYVRLGPLCK